MAQIDYLFSVSTVNFGHALVCLILRMEACNMYKFQEMFTFPGIFPKLFSFLKTLFFKNINRADASILQHSDII